MYREKDSEILAEAEIALPLALKCGGLRRAKAQKLVILDEVDHQRSFFCARSEIPWG